MTDTPATLKRTPLRDVHAAAGAKMVPFGGWDMPVQYTGIIEEHRCVRSAVGLFDISHMGEFEVRGPGAGRRQTLTTNDASTLAIGQVSTRCSAIRGGIVDDLTLVIAWPGDHYMLTVNAQHRQGSWGTEGARRRLDERERRSGPLAVQGPRAEGPSSSG
jgi:aminomethyltransferase